MSIINTKRRIRCPKCGSGNTLTSGYSNYRADSNTYLRGKVCQKCKNKFSTVEAISTSYDSASKIANGILELIRDNLLIEK